MIGKCVKQEVIAIIENNGQYWISSNYCNNSQKKCPRKNMKTGIGYDLCYKICNQENHAEVNVCIKAKEKANNGTLYLIGHTYCCDNCIKYMNKCGIKKIIFNKYPWDDNN